MTKDEMITALKNGASIHYQIEYLSRSHRITINIIQMGKATTSISMSEFEDLVRDGVLCQIEDRKNGR